jgi:nitrogen fixation protein FixH
MSHAIYFLMFVVVAILATVSLVKAAKASQSYNTVVADGVVESYARANDAVVEARQRHQRTYARYVAASGRALTAEVLAVRADGNFELRRRGHRHSAPFVRPVSEVFPR